MALSSDLISQFVQVTKKEKQNKESTVYGTIKEYNGGKYVQLDGSELLTPISTTADALDGEKVTVMIKDHTAIVTGNLSSPSARTGTVKEMGNKISEFEVIIADKVSASRLEAEIARINTLVSENVTIKGRLDVNEANIQSLTADNATINGKLTAAEANIGKLQTDKLNVSDADLKYANIDFANINMTSVKKLFTDSGIIKDLVVSDGKITGELVGVTIKGDLIEANTVKADKLVIKGSDGLYYKLNVDSLGETTASSDEKYQNGLDGSVIIAKSIVAEKIAVDDLVAFGATIGGFHISEKAIYSGVKTSVNNTFRGIYIDNDGQFSVGDSNNYLKFFKDTDEQYKLQISASSMSFSSSGKTVEEEINDLKDEVSTLLCIESSRGIVFKNNSASTVLSVVIYRGSQRIIDMATLKSVMGNSVYLEWSWQRNNEEIFGVISASDSRIGNEGFTFTLSPDDFDNKVTFLCKLIVPDSI